MLDFFMWAGNLCTISAWWLIAYKKVPLGLSLGLVAGSLWGTAAVMMENKAILFLMVALAVGQVRGLYLWAKGRG
jgi:hypothetical protein